MAQTSFALLTNLGRAKEAAALAGGTAVVITNIAIGDGVTVPSGGETALYHEVARKAISGSGTVVGSSNVAYFDAYLAAGDGPYTIREAGLIDSAGDLIAIAYYDPPINKPVPSSGQTVEGTVRLEVAFSNLANIAITIDPAIKVALQRLSRLPWIPILSMTTTAPPGSPVVGDCYLVPTGASGSWSGQAGKVAEFTTAGWALLPPPDGHGVGLPDGSVYVRIGGTYVKRGKVEQTIVKAGFTFAAANQDQLAVAVRSFALNYVAGGGTANAITATLDPPITSYSQIRALFLVPGSSNNAGSVTINVNGIGAIPVKSRGATLLPAATLLAGVPVVLLFDGTSAHLDGYVPQNGEAAFYVSGNWTCPVGVAQVYQIVTGGGGGGLGCSASQGGATGGGGGTAMGFKPVTPGSVYPAAIGAGGAGGAINLGSNGSAGGSTTFNGMQGNGGGGANLSGIVNGAGGLASGGTLNISGSDGMDGVTGSSDWAGNGGGSWWGTGQSSGVTTVGPAAIPGSGGASAYGTTARAGGAGADGIVYLRW
ncbi:phage tail-collar fiber domain-containing protein [Ancylobacter amanitiformis]|uniref:DUF2793 domain-containing protein n=1 Tax=Ancylobacter amanitiformis TaxID=217069 RepID=A0ABU0LQ94_9HYPH|nr:phage tail protein [Ancylobacter amanitiformis]MDQ0510876.1 hypothetical protein [Ancylobacter amanitiformis]